MNATRAAFTHSAWALLSGTVSATPMRHENASFTTASWLSQGCPSAAVKAHRTAKTVANDETDAGREAPAAA